MVEMIFQFADFALKKCPEQGKIQVLDQHFHVSSEHKPGDKTLFLPSGQSVSAPLGYLTLSIITLYVIWFVQEVVPVLVDYCLLLKRL